MAMYLIGEVLVFLVLIVQLMEAQALSPPFLLYTATGGGGIIKGRDLNGSPRRDLINHDFSGQSDTGLNGNCAQDVDYDIRRGLVYWADSCDGKIRKAALDSYLSTDVTVVLEQGGGAQLWGIAVDWVNNKLFYTDKTNNEIYVYDVTTNATQLLISGEISDLKDIAVDPLNGWMYWAQGSMIERADLQGQSRETLHSSVSAQYIYITIDYQNQRLYWGASWYIRSSFTDGSNYTSTPTGHNSNRGVAYYNGTLYYAYYSSLFSTYATDKLILSDGSTSLLGTDGGIQPRGHHVVALSRQPVPPGFECEQGLDNCDVNAACSATEESYTCTCKAGYMGNGLECEDVDECEQGSDDCDSNAQCTNTEGSYDCTCVSGFTGSGSSCEDIDECEQGSNDCDSNAQCTNTDGSYICTCISGFTGSGSTCEDIDECEQGMDDCHRNAQCNNTEGSFTCTCNTHFRGYGRSCFFDASAVERQAYPPQIVMPDDTSQPCPTDEQHDAVLSTIRNDIRSIVANLTRV